MVCCREHSRRYFVLIPRSRDEEEVADRQAGEQKMGDAVSAGPGAQVTMNCTFSRSTDWTRFKRNVNADLDKYNDSTKQYDQTVSLDGKVVSRISTGQSTTSLTPFPDKADTFSSPKTPVSLKAGAQRPNARPQLAEATLLTNTSTPRSSWMLLIRIMRRPRARLALLEIW